MKKILLAFCFVILALPVFAHGGRTDSSGGHNCNVGHCAGTYHYHNGGRSTYTPPAPVKSIPNCPSNASYSYLKDTCLCDIGYKISSDRTSCVIEIVIPDIPTCPAINSHYNSTLESCVCNDGYKPSSDKERCITIPDCPDNASFSLAEDKCICSIGYYMGGDDRSCFKNRVAPANGYLTRKGFDCYQGFKREHESCVRAPDPKPTVLDEFTEIKEIETSDSSEEKAAEIPEKEILQETITEERVETEESEDEKNLVHGEAIKTKQKDVFEKNKLYENKPKTEENKENEIEVSERKEKSFFQWLKSWF